MKTIIYALLLSLQCLMLMACEKDNSEATAEQIREAEDVGNHIVPSGETAKDYYTHFYMVRIEFCPNPFSRFAGVYNVDLGNDELGRGLYGSLAIMLFDRGDYYAYYTESSLKKTKKGFKEAQRLNVKFKRRWKYDGSKIVLEDLGVGDAVMVDGIRTIQLKVERDLIRQGLAGRTLEIRALTSNDFLVPNLDNCAK